MYQSTARRQRTCQRVACPWCQAANTWIAEYKCILEGVIGDLDIPRSSDAGDDADDLERDIPTDQGGERMETGSDVYIGIEIVSNTNDEEVGRSSPPHAGYDA